MAFLEHFRRPSPSLEAIEAAAAAWLSLRDRGMNASETAEFMCWLQKDVQHAAVFAELDRIWRDFDRLAVVPAVGAPEADGDLLVPRARTRRHRMPGWAAIGVAAAAAIALLTVTRLRTPRPTAETSVGAFQKVDLPDGSIAQLNTDTAIDTTFTATERRVRVLRGEVYFSVTKDKARPFIVTAGPVAVRAVGTAFNVRQRETAVEVLVTEGRVSLHDAGKGQSLLATSGPAAGPPLLFAGERALVALNKDASALVPAAATVVKVTASEMEHALAWQERRLEFDGIPLTEVTREFNRYNRQQLVIADTQLGTKRFSGSFRADGYESLVRLLEQDFGVTTTRNDREIILRGGR